MSVVLPDQSNQTEFGTSANSFAATKSELKIRPVNGGNLFTQNQQFQITIPKSDLGFIEPNSLYLKVRVDVEVGNTSGWCFAGQGTNYIGGGSWINNPSPGSMILDKVQIYLPNGNSMVYQQYNIFNWAIVINHGLTRDYVQTTLKELMHCHTVRVASDATAGNRTAYLLIPLDLPIFNAKTAFPLCLIREDIVLEFTLSPVSFCFSANTNAVTGYSVSEMCLMYTEISVTPEFKAAILRRPGPYRMPVIDRMYLGAHRSATTGFRIGANLSSLRAVLGTSVNVRSANTDPLFANASKLLSWNLFLDSVRQNKEEIDDEVTCYFELARALDTLTPDHCSDFLALTTGTTAGTTRNNYVEGAFAFGQRTAKINSSSFELTGIPVNEIYVDFTRGNSDVAKWTSGNYVTNSMTHMWALYDALVTIQPDGSFQINR